MPPQGVPLSHTHRAAISAAVRQSYVRRGRMLPMQRQVIQCAMNYARLADRQERMPAGTADERLVYERLVSAEAALRRICRQFDAAASRQPPVRRKP